MKLEAIAFVCVVTLVPARAFESKEHKAIGDAAWKQALATLDKEAPDASAKVLKLLATGTPVAGSPEEPICAVDNGNSFARFSFGDLVAIYGDWALTTTEVNTASTFSPRVSNLKDLVSGALKDPPKDEYEYMIELASNNYTHFSTEALHAYKDMHSLALKQAADKNQVRLALHSEALALHSFTDLYAFGHMLEDRETTKALVAWAQDTDHSAAMSLGRYGALAMGGMANFYHNAYNYKGALVRNLAKDEWRTYGDGKYFDEGSEKMRDMVVKGTAASLVAVLRVAAGLANPPNTTFAATQFLPIEYWDTQEPVAPKDQIPNILMLIPTQKMVNRPIEKFGFDFSLNILQYKDGEKKGRVKYADEVEKLQGR